MYMNTLLTSVGEFDIYTNDLLRYYTDGKDKVQYGIALSYDYYENRITVRAVTEALVNPVNVIEVYHENEWKDIHFTRYGDSVSMTIYPFDGDWIITDKKRRESRIVADLPYYKHGTFVFTRIMDMSEESFQKQISMLLASIIDEEILDNGTNFNTNNNSLTSIKIARKLPYTGNFNYTNTKFISYENNQSALKTQILNTIYTVIGNNILGVEEEVIDLTELINGKIDDDGNTIPVIEDDEPVTNQIPTGIQRVNYATGIIQPINASYSHNITKVTKQSKKVTLPYTTSYTMDIDDFNNISFDKLKENIVTDLVNVIRRDIMDDKDGFPMKFIGNMSFESIVDSSIDKVTKDIEYNSRALVRRDILNYSSAYPYAYGMGYKIEDLMDLSPKTIEENILYNIKAIIQKDILYNSTVFPYKYEGVFTTDFLMNVNNANVLREIKYNFTKAIQADFIDSAIEIDEKYILFPYRFDKEFTLDDYMNSTVDKLLRDAEFNYIQLIKNNILGENDILPYRYESTVETETFFHDIPERTMRNIRYGIIDVVRKQILSKLIPDKDDYEVYLKFPFRYETTMDVNMLLEYGTEYFVNMATGAIKDIVMENLIDKYSFSNGTITVFELPWTTTWVIDEWDLINAENTHDIILRLLDHIGDILKEKSKLFNYTTIINKEKINVYMVIKGASLYEIDNQSLKNHVIDEFENILLNLNNNYWTIKTRLDAIGHTNYLKLPLIETMELVTEECNNQRKVFRMYINHSNEIFRAYLLINASKRNRLVSIACPHIYSQNSLVLAYPDSDDNPLQYKEDYLKYLINNKRNDVINLIEADHTYH